MSRWVLLSNTENTEIFVLVKLVVSLNKYTQIGRGFDITSKINRLTGVNIRRPIEYGP